MSNSESFTLPFILKQHGNDFRYFLPKCPVLIFGYATSSVSDLELEKNIWKAIPTNLHNIDVVAYKIEGIIVIIWIKFLFVLQSTV